MAGKISRERLTRFVELQERRRKLNREVRQIEREEKAIRSDIVAECDRKGGSFTRFGFRCILTDRAGRPRWQDEFIARVGLEAAARIEAATPPTKVLNVHSPL